jgi:hypothetical protein
MITGMYSLPEGADAPLACVAPASALSGYATTPTAALMGLYTRNHPNLKYACKDVSLLLYFVRDPEPDQADEFDSIQDIKTHIDRPKCTVDVTMSDPYHPLSLLLSTPSTLHHPKQRALRGIYICEAGHDRLTSLSLTPCPLLPVQYPPRLIGILGHKVLVELLNLADIVLRPRAQGSDAQMVRPRFLAESGARDAANACCVCKSCQLCFFVALFVLVGRSRCEMRSGERVFEERCPFRGSRVT